MSKLIKLTWPGCYGEASLWPWTVHCRLFLPTAGLLQEFCTSVQELGIQKLNTLWICSDFFGLLAYFFKVSKIKALSFIIRANDCMMYISVSQYHYNSFCISFLCLNYS